MAISAVFLVFSLFSQCMCDVGLLDTESSTWSDTICTIYNKDWGHVPITDHPSTMYRAEEASDQLSCTQQSLTNVGGAIVCLRGNCSFCEKAQYAESAGAKLLVVVYNGSDILVDMVCDDGDHTPSIPVLLVTNDSGWNILHTLTVTNLTLAPYIPLTTVFDPAAIITLLIAVVTVVLGSYIANTPFQFMRYGLLLRQGEDYGNRSDSKRSEEGGVKIVVMTIMAILLFLVLLCVMLLLLYYFYYPMVYIVIAIYCVGASVGIFYLLSPFIALIPLFKNIRLPENKIPILEYRPDPRLPLTVLLCIAITIWWLIERHSIYGWILQDILGFAFLTHVLSRMIFLPTWVVAVAMVFLFFYDIIMVFITPFLTEDHDSVMVKAATGGGGDNVEPLPIVFIVPKLLPSILDKVCSSSYTGYLPYSLLGYGDVGVPGLLITLCLKYDMTHTPSHWFKLYYCISSIAYCVGLCVTYVALFTMETAQPALLYLVPTTLGSIVIVTLLRKEFKLFFTGHQYKASAAGGVTNDVNVQSTILQDEDRDSTTSDPERETLINNNH